MPGISSTLGRNNLCFKATPTFRKREGIDNCHVPGERSLVQIVEMTLFSTFLKELDCGGFTEGSRYKDKNIHLR